MQDGPLPPAPEGSVKHRGRANYEPASLKAKTGEFAAE